MLFCSCNEKKSSGNSGTNGKLIVFHAGSLSVPFRQLARSFEETNPEAEVQLESAGSVACARKITDLHRSCDVIASADYKVIDEMLVPDYAAWNIQFAQNEIAIVYGTESNYSTEINADNWYEILLREDVTFGRSDPHADPCGYRTKLSVELAEQFHGVEGLFDKLMSKDREYIRPKEVDLLALMEVGAIDYMFIYSSVAVQHNLPYLQLNDSLNLKNPDLKSWYAGASTQIHGKKPGEKLTIVGEPIVYGITILNEAPNPRLAEKFVAFLLDREKGGTIMKNCGQGFLSPPVSLQAERLPLHLKKYCIEQ